MTALLSGTLYAARRPQHFILSTIIAVVFLISHWLLALIDYEELVVVGLISGGLFFAYIAVILIFNMFLDHDRVNSDLIYGAISVYLLIGTSFAFLHATISILSAGAYQGMSVEGTGDSNVFAHFFYYSFVTLTTLGYGDIRPIVRFAEIAAYMEAIVGQLYLTILVARLVGMHITKAPNN